MEVDITYKEVEKIDRVLDVLKNYENYPSNHAVALMIDAIYKEPVEKTDRIAKALLKGYKETFMSLYIEPDIQDANRQRLKIVQHYGNLYFDKYELEIFVDLLHKIKQQL